MLSTQLSQYRSDSTVVQSKAEGGSQVNRIGLDFFLVKAVKTHGALSL
jgi:hypothetical protein